MGKTQFIGLLDPAFGQPEEQTVTFEAGDEVKCEPGRWWHGRIREIRWNGTPLFPEPPIILVERASDSVQVWLSPDKVRLRDFMLHREREEKTAA